MNLEALREPRPRRSTPEHGRANLSTANAPHPESGRSSRAKLFNDGYRRRTFLLYNMSLLRHAAIYFHASCRRGRFTLRDSGHSPHCHIHVHCRV